MKRAMCVVIVLALLIVAMPAFAQQVLDPRLEELRQQYLELSKQKLAIESGMIRLECQFIESQQMIAEQKIEALEATEPVAEVVEETPEPEAVE